MRIAQARRPKSRPIASACRSKSVSQIDCTVARPWPSDWATRTRRRGGKASPALLEHGLELTGLSHAVQGFFFVRPDPDMSQLLA